MTGEPEKRWGGELPFSLRCASRGLTRAFARERNLRIHTGVAILVLAWGLAVHLSAQGMLWLTLAITLVFVSELLNSSLEALVDLCSPGEHPLAGLAKDIAAGAVLVACGFAVLVGLVILGPSLWEASLG